MNVKLLEHTHLSSAVIGLRNCWDSYHRGGNYKEPTDNISEEDKKFLDRVINKHKHETGAEFLQYIFKIEGISIGCQNQLVRHRTASYLVRSTRYCSPEDYIQSGNDKVDKLVASFLVELSQIKDSNDVKKYAIPQATSTNVVMRIDGRNLRNFLSLRTDSHAHFEIRELAKKIWTKLPKEHKFLYKDYIHD